MITTSKRRSCVQLILLILIAVMVWYIFHRSPSVPGEVYPYLNSITLESVKKSAQDYRSCPKVSWEDILAMRSTLPEKDVQALINQLNNDIPFAKLNWGSITAQTTKLVYRHQEILKKYTFYKPHSYIFPVVGKVWFEDSFGADREGGVRKHEGSDLFGNEGTPIVNCCGGVVEQLGWNRLGGERVGIRGDDGNYYYYAHLQSISPVLEKGRRLDAGQLIGYMGHTGDALTTPDHLHFGIELPNGQWTNPYPFLAVWQFWGGE